MINVKVKQSLYRPIRGPEGSRKLRPPNFETKGHESNMVVSPTRQPLLPVWYSFMLEAHSNPRTILRGEALRQ